MADSKTTPVALVGSTERIGQMVIDGLKPEYEGLFLSMATYLVTWPPAINHFIQLGIEQTEI